jgi:hypothetical protein
VAWVAGKLPRHGEAEWWISGSRPGQEKRIEIYRSVCQASRPKVDQLNNFAARVASRCWSSCRRTLPSVSGHKLIFNAGDHCMELSRRVSTPLLSLRTDGPNSFRR